MNSIFNLQSAGRVKRHIMASAVDVKSKKPVILKFTQKVHNQIIRNGHIHNKVLLMERSFK